MSRFIIQIALSWGVLLGAAAQVFADPAFDWTLPPPQLDFEYPELDTSHLAEIRNEVDFPRIVRPEYSELEKVAALTTLTSRMWEHDSWNRAENVDPLEIIRAAKQGKRFRCVEYALVLSALAQAAGLPARVVYLARKDVETARSGAGHAAVEVYIPDKSRWVFADAQWNIVPTVAGQPLNGVELAAAVNDKRPLDSVTKLASKNRSSYASWIRPYLYYFTTALNGRSAAAATTRVTLLPIGAAAPGHFQRRRELAPTLFTYSAQALYPAPLAFGSSNPYDSRRASLAPIIMGDD